MIIKFINENKVQVFILSILFLIIFFYLYDKHKKEHLNAGVSAGGILFAICGAILPCICWCFIMYFISKKAAAAAIRESSSNTTNSE